MAKVTPTASSENRGETCKIGPWMDRKTGGKVHLEHADLYAPIIGEPSNPCVIAAFRGAKKLAPAASGPSASARLSSFSGKAPMVSTEKARRASVTDIVPMALDRRPEKG